MADFYGTKKRKKAKPDLVGAAVQNIKDKYAIQKEKAANGGNAPGRGLIEVPPIGWAREQQKIAEEQRLISEQLVQVETPKEETPKEETPEEKRERAKNLPMGYSMDKEGNITQLTDRFGNPTAENKAAILRTQEIAASGGGVESPLNEDKMRMNAQRQQRIQQLMQMGEQGLLTPEELQAIAGNDINIGQTLGAGLMAAGPGAAAGIGSAVLAGAVGGTAVAPGIGTLLGAIGGAGAFLIGARNSIKSEQSESFGTDREKLSRGMANMKLLIADTKANPQNAELNIQLFNSNLNMIATAHAKTKRDSQENLNIWLGNDGSKQLEAFETFELEVKPILVSKFQTALMNPTGNNMDLSDDDLEYYNSLMESGE